jgi:hypothetical protein
LTVEAEEHSVARLAGVGVLGLAGEGGEGRGDLFGLGEREPDVAQDQERFGFCCTACSQEAPAFRPKKTKPSILEKYC